MTPKQAASVQATLDASLAFRLPEPEVTELTGEEAALMWRLAVNLQDFEPTVPMGLDGC